jgi:hypothetical protein
VTLEHDCLISICMETIGYKHSHNIIIFKSQSDGFLGMRKQLKYFT